MKRSVARTVCGGWQGSMLASGLVGALVAGLGGCGTTGSATEGLSNGAAQSDRAGPLRTLSSRDFSVGQGPTGVFDVAMLEVQDSGHAAGASDGGNTPRVEDDGGLASSDELVVRPGVPSRRGVGTNDGEGVARSLPASPVGRPILIDAKLGDINGNPIYASVFLDTGSTTVEPIGRRLAEESRRRPLAQWRLFAREEIAKRVALFVRDELLRAEALATLNQDQQQGFLAFIDRLQRDTQRRLGGSRAVAERRLEQTEGVSFDEWKRRERDRKLIEFQLQEKVSKRVQVSSRDIAQRYDQLADRFNQPPLATFRQIVVPASKAEVVDQVASRLAGGEEFQAIARSEANSWKREAGGLEAREVKGDRLKGQFFGNEKLNDAARTLGVGEYAGPIEVSNGKAFLYLESIVDRTKDLYEAQVVLEDQIREERFNRALERYFTRLASRMSVSDTEDVVEQLARVAESRYIGDVDAQGDGDAGR